MKKILLLVILLSIPLTSSARMPFPPEGYRIVTPPTERETPCTSATIVIDIDTDPDPLGTINKAFLNYDTPECFSSANNRYELIFDFRAPLEITAPLHFVRKNNTKDVLIKGLNLVPASLFPSSTDFLIHFTNEFPGGKIILHNLNISGMSHGVRLNGSQEIDLINSVIGGDGSGACLLLNGSNNKIINNRINNCNEAIHIEGGNDNSIGAANSSTIESEKNIIQNSRIGINWISGNRNKFPFNSYNNVENAIIIDPALGITRPEILIVNRESGQSLNYEGELRWLEVSNVDPAKELIIYKIDAIDLASQPKDYFTKCTIDSERHCNIPSDTEIGEGGITMVVAMISSDDYTSEPSDPVGMGPPITAIGVGSVADMPGGVAEASDFEDTSLEEGADMSGEVTGTSVGSTPFKAASCNVVVPPANNRTIITGLGMWWIIFAVPIAILCLVRIKKRK